MFGRSKVTVKYATAALRERRGGAWITHRTLQYLLSTSSYSRVTSQLVIIVLSQWNISSPSQCPPMTWFSPLSQLHRSALCCNLLILQNWNILIFNILIFSGEARCEPGECRSSRWGSPWWRGTRGVRRWSWWGRRCSSNPRWGLRVLCSHRIRSSH